MQLPPTATTTTTALALALAIGLTGLLPVTRDAHAAAAPAVVNGSGEPGPGGFVATPAARVRLTSTSMAHTGSRALRVRTTRPIRVRVRATGVDATLPVSSSAVAGVWVRTPYASQRVSLVLTESVTGGLVQRRTATATPAPRTWTRLTTRLVTRQDDSVVEVVVRTARTGNPLDLFIDDVVVASRPPVAVPSTPVGGGVGSLSNGCAYSARGIPTCGGYLGSAYGSNSEPTDLESQLGRRLGIRRTFWTAVQVDKAVATARADVAKGRLPWISFKLPTTWQAMTAGQGDAWARDVATKLATIPGPVWLAFHHEPEGDGDITAWRTMQERLAPLIRTAPNVAYTIVLTGWNQFFGASQYSLANLWPRNTKIDIAGFDLYNEYGVVKNGKTITTWPDFDRDYFAPIQAWAAQQGVAWGIAETAYTDQAHTRTPTWIKTTYDQMLARGGVAMTYFNTTLNAYGSWALTTDSKRAALATPLTRSAALPLP